MGADDLPHFDMFVYPHVQIELPSPYQHKNGFCGDCFFRKSSPENLAQQHRLTSISALPTIMHLFALLYTETYDGCVFQFPMRRANNAGDYIIALLLEEKQEVSSVLSDFLQSVVLDHVWDVDIASITVSGYDADTDSMILLDSAPSKEDIADALHNGGHRGRAVARLMAYEQSTADRYVVPMSKILANIKTRDHVTWTLIEQEELEACPCYRKTSASKAAVPVCSPSKKRQLDVDEE